MVQEDLRLRAGGGLDLTVLTCCKPAVAQELRVLQSVASTAVVQQDQGSGFAPTTTSLASTVGPMCDQASCPGLCERRAPDATYLLQAGKVVTCSCVTDPLFAVFFCLFLKIPFGYYK